MICENVDTIHRLCQEVSAIRVKGGKSTCNTVFLFNNAHVCLRKSLLATNPGISGNLIFFIFIFIVIFFLHLFVQRSSADGGRQASFARTAPISVFNFPPHYGTKVITRS